MTDETVARVIAMINRALDAPVENLSADSRVLEISGFDSLAMERLAAELGEARGGEVNPLAFAQVETIRDLADLLEAESRSAS